MKRYKKIVALLLALGIVVSDLPVTMLTVDATTTTENDDALIISEEEEIIAEGTSGSNLIWTLNADGVFTVSGEGAMSDYSQNATPWDSYAASITSVVIEEGVTSIGAYAFYGCNAIVNSLMIPATVKSIGDYAFCGCTNVSNILFEEGLESIGTYAFGNCTSLNELMLPSSLLTIGDYAFRKCTSIKGDLIIPALVSTIGKYAFSECTGFDGALIIEEGSKSIGNFAFNQCTGFTSLSLGDGITSIGESAFAQCKNIKGDLIIPDSVTTLGSRAFYQCVGFDGCLTLSNGLNTILNQSFYECSGLSGTLIIPDSILSIGQDALYKLEGITELYIGSGVKTITGSLAYGMNAVKKITFAGTTVPTCSSTSVFGGMNSLEEICVPTESYDDYLAAFRTMLPANVQLRPTGTEGDFLVEDGVLKAYFGLGTTVTIPDGVVSIDAQVFMNCTAIKEVVFNEGLESIGSSAFYGCTGLLSLDLPESLKEINSNAFYGCTGLKGDMVIPESVTTIGEYAFYNCTGLTGLTLSSQLTILGEYSFYNCDGLTGTVQIPAQVMCVGDYAFYDCDKLEGLLLESGVEKLGQQAFNSCDSLKNIKLSNTLTEIGANCFAYCKALEGDLHIPKSVTMIGSHAFYQCTSLGGELVIEDALASIGDHAFYQCAGLSRLSLGDGITSIGKCAFQECTGLKGDLIIPDTVTSIGSAAFRGCTGFDGELSLSANLQVLSSYVFCDCNGFIGVLNIPDNVTTIETQALVNMAGIEEVVVGSSVSNMTNASFYGMTSLRKVTFTGNAVPSFQSALFSGTSILEYVYVPNDSYASYMEAFKSILPENTILKPIGVEGDFWVEDGTLKAYYGTNALVTIPEGVKVIDSQVFMDLTYITEVVLCDGIEEIGDSAFYGCTGLKTIELPDSLQVIGNNAFNGCVGISNALKMPDSLVIIGNYAFNQCNSINGELNIPNGVSVIGDYAFYNCIAIDSLTLGEGVQTIGNFAFANCTGMSGNLVIPSSVTSVGSNAFYACTGFDGKLLIQTGEKTIADYAFAQSTGFTELEILEGITAIGKNAFQNCTGMKGDLIIPNSVTEIGEKAFYGCTGFDGSLTLSESLTSIETSVFQGCTNISGEIIIPNSVTNVRSGAFYGLEKVDSIVFGENISVISNGGSLISLGEMTNIKTVTFMSQTVPTVGANIFRDMEELRTIYVPADSYNEYVSTFVDWVDDVVVFTSDFSSTSVSNLHTSNVYSKTVVLNWKSHASREVVGYKVRRDGELVGTTTECSFVEHDLKANTTYSYSVTGYFVDGTETGEATILVTPKQPEIQDIKTGNEFNRLGSDNTIYVYVKDNNNLESYDGKDVVAKLYYMNAEKKTFIQETSINKKYSNNKNAVYSVDWDISVLEDGIYDVIFEITDIDGQTVEYTEQIVIDRGVPAKIEDLRVEGDKENRIAMLEWNVAKEEDTEIYRVYRRAANEEKFTRIAQVSGRETVSFENRGLDEKIYYYYVVGVNPFGSEGESSDIVGVAMITDTTDPCVESITPNDASVVSGEIEFKVTASDNVAVTSVAIYLSIDDGKSWTLINENDGSVGIATVDTTKYDITSMRIKVLAFDAAGNESDASIYTYELDNVGPEQVTNVVYESLTTEATLSWDGVSDKDISFYRVEQLVDNQYVMVQDIYNATGFYLSNLEPNSTYLYRVVAYDIYGNRGKESEVTTVTTVLDKNKPYAEIISENGVFSDKASFEVWAKDDFGIKSVVIQISNNLKEWTEVYSKEFETADNDMTWLLEFNLINFEEDNYYARAIVKDIVGNESSSNFETPYVTFSIDKTAPVSPKDLMAISQNGSIKLSWMMNNEDDFEQYSIYKSTDDGKTFELLKEGLSTTNYIDYVVMEGETYFYKIVAQDVAGNISEFSEMISGKSLADTETPVFETIYPSAEAVIGSEDNIYATVTDNGLLQNVMVEYSTDNKAFTEILSESNINSYGYCLDVVIPDEAYEANDIYVRMTASDVSGNVSEECCIHYIVDKTAPLVQEVLAKYDEEKVRVSWTGMGEEDIDTYRVYRKISETGKFELLDYIEGVDGQEEYVYEDTALAKTATVYIYKIEAIDIHGNYSAKVSKEIVTSDRSDSQIYAPEASFECDLIMIVGETYTFDASSSTDDTKIVSYSFDFGDGTITNGKNVSHVYDEVGKYRILLTVEDEDGLVGTLTKMITVKESEVVASAKIRVLSEAGSPIPNASVYFDLGEEEQIIKTTDAMGYVTFNGNPGVHAVGCIVATDNSWQPTKKDIALVEGQEVNETLMMIREPLITGEFDSMRLTYEQIVAAGIDVNNPDNHHIIKVNIRFTNGGDGLGMDVLYNPTTGENMSGGTLRYVSFKEPGKGKKEHNNNSSQESADKEEEKEKAGDKNDEERQATAVIANADGKGSLTVAIIDVPVEASFLKEFFHVKLTVLNGSYSDLSLLDNRFKLNIPDGITPIMCFGNSVLSDDKDSVTVTEITSLYYEDGTTRVDEIKARESSTVKWILRGDKEGTYDLSAEYSGVLESFNRKVSARFASMVPLRVYGTTVVKMIVEYCPTVSYDAFYFNISLKNISNLDVNMPSINIVNNLISTYYSTIYANKKMEVNDDNNPEVRLLNKRITDINGYSERIGTVANILTLSPDESVTNEYAAYNVFGCDYEEILRKATYEIASDYGIEVEIIETDMNFYNLEDALEKWQKILDKSGDPSIKNDFDYIMDHRNFQYMREALESNEDWSKQGLELLTRGLDGILNWDFKVLVKGHYADITNDLVMKLLRDESMDENIQKNYAEKILDIVQTGIDAGVDTFEVLSKEEEEYKKKVDKFKTGINIAEYVVIAQQDGFGKVKEKFYEDATKYGLSKLVDKATTDLTMGKCIEEKLLSNIKLFSSVCTNQLKGLEGDWYEAQETVEKMLLLQASYDESKELLTILKNKLYHGKSATISEIYDEVLEIDKDLDKEVSQVVETIENQIITLIENAGEKAFEVVIQECDDCFDLHLGTGFEITKLIYNLIKKVTKLDDSITEIEKARVYFEFSYAFQEEANYAVKEGGILTDTVALRRLRGLKYLIKMRLIGEQDLINSYTSREEIDQTIMLLKLSTKDYQINQNGYETLDQYRDQFNEKILRFRDTIFSTYYDDTTRTEAPKGTIDFVNHCTHEIFSTEFEYSFDNITWTSCENKAISFVPGDAQQLMYIRKKSTDSEPSSNKNVLIIPAMEFISGYFPVTYNGQQYVLNGMEVGNYSYAFVNDMEEEIIWQDEFEVVYEDDEKRKVNTVVLEENEHYEYIALQRQANEYQFESQIRYMPIEVEGTKTWEYKLTENYIVGVPEGMQSKELLSYYQDLGLVTYLMDASGEITDTVATGCTLYIGGEAYTVVVTGDVNGDAIIDIFDVCHMVDHMNSVEQLEGAYYEAACVNDDEEMDIFDLCSVSDYLTLGEFTY